MTTLLIIGLVISNIYACWLAFHWKEIATFNTKELEQLLINSSRDKADAKNKGYLIGVKTGVASMYRAAARAHASDMCMDVLRMEGHRLVGNETHDEMETV